MGKMIINGKECEFTTERNILDEVSATDNGYTPQTSIDPYYANPDDAIYPKLKDIAMNRLSGDACRTKIMEVIVEGEEEGSGEAWVEDVLVKPTSTGGDTAGFAIPFDVYFDGNRQQGTAEYENSYKTSSPTFSPNTGA